MRFLECKPAEMHEEKSDATSVLEGDIPTSQSNIPRDKPPVDNESLTRVPTDRAFGIPVNETKRAQQQPRRVLPCLPRVVQEILRWSIHPEEVLRGAASVSHLFLLQTINEESLMTAKENQTIAKPNISEGARMVTNVPPKNNRTLPSIKTTAKIRESFKKSMLPSLPTIKENTSKSIQDNKTLKQQEPNKPQERVNPQENVVSPKSDLGDQDFQERPLVAPKISRDPPNHLSSEDHASLSDNQGLPRLRAKVARRSKTIFEDAPNEAKIRSHTLKPMLPSPDTLIRRPRSSSKPTVMQTRSQITRLLPSISTVNGPVTPPATPKSSKPRMRSAAFLPLLNNSSPHGHRIPKPPSTPRRSQRSGPSPGEANNYRIGISHQLPTIKRVTGD